MEIKPSARVLFQPGSPNFSPKSNKKDKINSLTCLPAVIRDQRVFPTLWTINLRSSSDSDCNFNNLLFTKCKKDDISAAC